MWGDLLDLALPDGGRIDYASGLSLKRGVE
jgi:hypothetical protein